MVLDGLGTDDGGAVVVVVVVVEVVVVASPLPSSSPVPNPGITIPLRVLKDLDWPFCARF